MSIFKKRSLFEISKEICETQQVRNYPQKTTYYLFGIPVYEKETSILYHLGDHHVIRKDAHLLFL